MNSEAVWCGGGVYVCLSRVLAHLSVLDQGLVNLRVLD